MIIIDLTLSSGNKHSFIINGNVSFGDYSYQDGNHNNGGYKVKESREEIKAIITNAIDEENRKELYK
jgi:hypothetical protein